MNEELKATLDWLTECGNNDYLFETGNSRMLLIYITNLQQELQRKDNIINELKEELEFELQFQKGGCYNRIKNLLDKIKELENSRSDE